MDLISSNTDYDVAEAVAKHLKSSGSKLATAESCTGGWIAQAVTAIPGSSAWFDRGFVTYSNEAKQEMLGVSVELLQQYGAVSEQVAREMALGVLKHSNADISVATTGIAGPDGGSDEKPVGLVWFAWANKNGEVKTAQKIFTGDRTAIREQAVVFGLNGLLIV